MTKKRISLSKTTWNLSSREMQDILNSTHDAIIAVDNNGIIILFNTAAEKLVGVLSKDASGKFVRDVIATSRLPHVLNSGVAELNEQQELGNASIITNRVPVKDQHGRIVGAAAVFRDITEAQQLASEITYVKEMQELLEAIINATQDAISVVDDKEKVIMVNPVYTRLIGMSKEEVIGKSPAADIREGESVHLHVMRTLETVRGVPLRVGPANREVLVNAAPIIVNGRLRGSVAVAHDISEIKRLTEELARVKSLVNKGQARYTFDNIVAQSAAMCVAVEHARRAAATPVTVLLSGESGTGKELFAHAIHNASPRKARAFVRVNCAAIPETLLESELFGYEAGAFSGALKGGKRGLFEEANGGTLFLDEIGEISPAIQAKLLRVLQEKEIIRVGGVKPISVDVRIIAATNQNLESAISKGTFREDLYYRINVFPIAIPPLRHRIEELPLMVKYLLTKLNLEYGRSVQDISTAALAKLSEYSWPGNVRELENVLGRAVINMRVTEYVIEPVHLPPLSPKDGSINNNYQFVTLSPRRTLTEIAEETERLAIIAALAYNNGNRLETARQLGIATRSLYYKLAKHGIKGTEA